MELALAKVLAVFDVSFVLPVEHRLQMNTARIITAPPLSFTVKYL